MIFFIIFIIIPLIEIALFVSVGGAIGLFTTLFLCIVTAIIGAALIRYQGLKTLLSARMTIEQGGLPLHEFFDGLCLAVAGALLMTPGFFTDFIGFCLLIPRVRLSLQSIVATRLGLGNERTGFSESADPEDIIEAEYERLDKENKP
ncbi:MAG: hypothetical protein CO093_06835 [Alphaproteobacteria bacterium CG_4_9_14_3_um_filter_47_13]|nr:MAG: hypothetical protein CO093_06835 [Alphaproteobacteria bacterium CG_4_9_14_3_um_filter_47_13]